MIRLSGGDVSLITLTRRIIDICVYPSIRDPMKIGGDARLMSNALVYYLSVFVEISNFREIRIRFTSIHSSRARFIDLRRDAALFWGHRIYMCTRLQ